MRDKDFFIYGLGRMPRHNRTRSEKIQYLEEAGVDTSILDSIDEDEDLLSASKQARFLNSLVSEEKHKRGISNDLIAVLTCVGRSKSNNPLGADTVRTTQQRGGVQPCSCQQLSLPLARPKLPQGSSQQILYGIPRSVSMAGQAPHRDHQGKERANSRYRLW